MDSDSEHYSDDDSDCGSDWDEPDATWSEITERGVRNVIRNFKSTKGFYCTVCQRQKKRGFVRGNVKSLIQHCETMTQHRKQHKQFVKKLKEAMERKELSVRMHEVGNFAAAGGESGVTATTAEDMGTTVSPFVLILENVPLKNGDRTFVDTDEAWILRRLRAEGVKDASKAGLLPESVDAVTTCGYKARGFAIFATAWALDSANALFCKQGRGREDWKRKEVRLRGIRTSEFLFGYAATVSDMNIFDPRKRTISWSAASYKVLRYEPEKQRKEAMTEARKLMLELEEQSKAFAALAEDSKQSMIKNKEVARKRERDILSSRTQLEEAHEEFKEQAAAKEEKYKQFKADRMMELERKRQKLAEEDEPDAAEDYQIRVMQSLLEKKQAEEEAERMEKYHDEKVKDILKCQSETENLKEQARVMEAEGTKNDKEYQRMKEEQDKLEKSISSVRKGVAEIDVNKIGEEEQKELQKRFETLQRYGFNTGSLDQCKVETNCLGPKCRRKLQKPPPPSMSNNPDPYIRKKYNAYRSASRALMGPCGCVVYCLRCAMHLVNNNYKCPRCNIRVESAITCDFFGYSEIKVKK